MVQGVGPVQGLGLITAAAGTGALTLGSVLSARVQAMQDGQVTLQVAGRTVLATTDLPLTAGQNITVQVAATGGTTVLRLLESQPMAPQLLLSGPAELAARALALYGIALEPNAIGRLAQLLEGFGPAQREEAAAAGAWLLAQGRTPTVSEVQALQRLQREEWPLAGRLQALATLLAEVAATAPDPARRRLQTLVAVLRNWVYRGEGKTPPLAPLSQVLAETESTLAALPADPRRQQAQAALYDVHLTLLPAHARAGQWQVVPLPLDLPGLKGQALLVRRRHGRGAEAEEALELVLETEHLGRLSVRLQQQGGLGVTVTAVEGAAGAHLQTALPDLQAALQAAGSPPRRLRVTTGPVVVPPVLVPPAPVLPGGFDTWA